MTSKSWYALRVLMGEMERHHHSCRVTGTDIWSMTYPSCPASTRPVYTWGNTDGIYTVFSVRMSILQFFIWSFFITNVLSITIGGHFALRTTCTPAGACLCKSWWFMLSQHALRMFQMMSCESQENWPWPQICLSDQRHRITESAKWLTFLLYLIT